MRAHTYTHAPGAWLVYRGRGRLEGKWWYTRATRVNGRSRLMIPGVPIIDVQSARMNALLEKLTRICVVAAHNSEWVCSKF